MKGELSKSKLKFALMCNGSELQQWQHKALRLLLDGGNASLVLVITPKQQQLPEINRVKKVFTYSWGKVLFKKYYQYLFRPALLQVQSFNDLSGNVPVISCSTIRKGKYSEYFSDEDIQLIQSYSPDFILKFGFGILRGPVLDAVPYGIWSFHHGDEQKYRGVPPAFWEIMKNDMVTASILQRLTEKLDGGIILRKGYFPTISHSWKANLEQAIELSLAWPADVCREIAELNTFPVNTEKDSTSAPIFKIPGNLTMIQFLAKSFLNRIRFHLNEIFTAEKWQTGLIKVNPSAVVGPTDYKIDTAKVIWLKPGENHRYFADGFVIQANGQMLLLYEDYSYHTRKAHISATWFDDTDGSLGEVKPALIEPWHLSFPFLFKHENSIYCIPESMNHGSVELYELNTTTAQLQHVRTLVSGLAAADPSLTHYNNRWYLFFTAAHATNAELHLWHADTLAGPFVPHVLSPVKADVRNARPAGAFFKIGEKLYRPAQDCSETYGGRIVINEIKVLSPNSFVEVPVNVLEPPAGFTGLHTLSFSGEYLYFDVKKMVFVPSAALFQLKRRLKLVKPPKATSKP